MSDFHHFAFIQKSCRLTDPAFRHLYPIVRQLFHQLLLVIFDLGFRLRELFPFFLFILVHFPQLFQSGCTVRIIFQIQIFHQLTVVHIPDLYFVLQLDQFIDGLLHTLQFPVTVHVFDTHIGDCHCAGAYRQEISHISIHFKCKLQNSQHDHTHDQCRQEDYRHSPLIIHQILQFISAIFIGMPFSIQSMQILSYQIAVFFAFPDLPNPFFDLIFSFTDGIIIRIFHPVFLLTIFTAFLFQRRYFTCGTVDLPSLLCR